MKGLSAPPLTAHREKKRVAAATVGTAPCFIDVQIYLHAIIKSRAEQGYSELWHSYALIKVHINEISADMFSQQMFSFYLSASGINLIII